jgi:hypothetical protein
MIEYKENRFCHNKEHYISFLVLKNLCRVLKNHKLFVTFRCGVGINNQITAQPYISFPNLRDIMVNCLSENPFKGCETIEDILGTLSNMHHKRLDFNNEESVQLNILESINILLHALLERHLNSISRVEKIGEETFNITCEEVFGKGFKDLTTPPDVDMEKINKIREIIEKRRDQLTPEDEIQIARLQEHIRNHGFLPPFDNDEIVEETDDMFFVDEDEEEEEEMLPF